MAKNGGEKPKSENEKQKRSAQAGFNIKRCKTCGMMFTAGLESDEKLHSAYHSHSVKGIHFQARPASCVGFAPQMRT